MKRLRDVLEQNVIVRILIKNNDKLKLEHMTDRRFGNSLLVLRTLFFFCTDLPNGLTQP